MNSLYRISFTPRRLYKNKHGVGRVFSGGIGSTKYHALPRMSTLAAPQTFSPPLRLITPGQFTRSIIFVGFSMGLGDFTCQAIQIGSVFDVNFERSCTMAFIGSCITGPLSQTFQLVLERKVPGKALNNVMKKVGFSSIWAFFVSIPLLFTATTLLQKDNFGKRGTFQEALNKIKTDLLKTFAIGSIYWPFFNILIYKYVKIPHRAIVGSSIGTIWNIYLAAIANKKQYELELI